MPASTIDVPTPDGVADCYLTTPDDSEPRAGVLFVMDILGLRPRIEEMADRIAAEGYAVLAPNIFYRGGPAREAPDLRSDDARSAWVEEMWPLAQALTVPAIASDGAAYLDRLGEIVPGPFGLVGFCMGGRVAWEIAAAQPERVAALAGFHVSRMATDADDSPHRRAERVGAEVYWGFADEDAGMTAEMIATLDGAMDAAGVRHTTETYAGAHHGFTMSDTPIYDEAATERAFRNLLALLGRTVGG